MPVVDLLESGLEALSIDYSEETIESFRIYLHELKKWARVHNLTSLTDEEDIIIRHFLDSLLFLAAIPEDTKNIIDVGTGAGFPGVPLKILRPGIKLYLLEKRKKKTAFLRHIVSRLNLKEATILDTSLEELGKIDSLPLFEVAVTRALFSVRDFMDKVSLIVKEGGLMILSKGKNYEKELNNIDKKRVKIRRSFIPLTDIERYIITIAKLM